MNYLINLFTTGAIRKTPKKIIEQIVSEISDSKSGDKIIEIGAGKGEITSEVIKKMKKDIHINYHAFEIDQRAVCILKDTFPQIKVHNKNAFDFAFEVPCAFKADYIISSIPLSFYKKEKIKTLLESMYTNLNTNGKVIILFSAFWLIPLLKKEFKKGKFAFFFTFPPYFLFCFHKQENY